MFKLVLYDDNGDEADCEIAEWRVPGDADNVFAQTVGHNIVSAVGEAMAEPVLRLTPLQLRLDGMTHADLMQWVVAYNQYVMDYHDRECAGREGNWPVCFLEFTMSEEGAIYLKNMFGQIF
jgi:hypothetical protein